MITCRAPSYHERDRYPPDASPPSATKVRDMASGAIFRGVAKMQNKGPQVAELAHELGVTSRELIDRCRVEGLKLQNSITRIKPEQVPLVRAWLNAESTSPDET